jgi:tRNA 5-methylaminomethyl-2-thiouridine biosynthesis bifunctional protein
MCATNAKIDWVDGQPYSATYGDVYFSRDNGLEESAYVFLLQNHLQQRWETMGQSVFTIAETGFGTGLNFLCAWNLWQTCAPPHARLHFISTEKHPLSHADLKAALSLWPTLAEKAALLLDQYHWITPGWHGLVFDQGNVTLTLVIGDIAETLPQIHARVDAWFLDGFSPAQNPDMWQESLFRGMARLSHASTTFATFTSAGIVKRGLQAAGFSVSKVAGYGRKREMLRGQFNAGDSKERSSISKAQQAIVIGGGISGTSTAYALAQRGWRVTLVERHAMLASEASGNPMGIVYPRLSAKDCALDRMALQGYLHTLRLLAKLKLSRPQHSACGVIQLGFNAKELAKIEAIRARALPDELATCVTASEASQIAGIPLGQAGLLFPSGGWVNPSAFCHALADHSLVSVKTAREALSLIKTADGWAVHDGTQVIEHAETVVIAGANDSMRFSQAAHVPLEPVRGQISLIHASANTEGLKTVLCTDGYITPASTGGQHCVGATFSPNDSDLEVREQDDLENLALLNKTLNADIPASAIAAARAALRTVTPDYLPAAGLLLDASAIQTSPPRHTALHASLPWLNGLYLNTGHGAKGLINAPLCGEILASHLCGEPAPVDGKLLAALDPNRFLLREMGLKRLVRGLAG